MRQESYSNSLLLLNFEAYGGNQILPTNLQHKCIAQSVIILRLGENAGSNPAQKITLVA